MDVPDRVNRIRSELAAIRDAQYAANSYTPIKKAYQKRKEREEDSNYNVKQMAKHLNGPIEDVAEISIITADIFNVNTNSEERTKWADMEIEDRFKKMEEFLLSAEQQYGEDINANLIKLVQEGRLNRKTDLIYDEINKKIVSLKVVKYNDEHQRYEITLDAKIEKDKARKRLKRIVATSV